MTPDEAMETLKLNHKAREALGSDVLNTPLLQAQQLGIEALEIIEEIRVANGLDRIMDVIWDKVFKPLPSETEEAQ